MRTTVDKKEVDYERVKFLYENTSTSYLGIITVIIFQSFFVYKFVSLHMAISWVAIMIISYIPRIILTLKMKKEGMTDSSSHDEILKWERVFFYASILPFISFSAVVFMPFGENLLKGLFSSSLLMIGLLSGGMILYSLSKKVILLYLNIVCSFIIVRCLSAPSSETIVLAICILILYIMLFGMIKKQYAMLLQNIMLKLENRNLSFVDPLTKLGNRRFMTLFSDKIFLSAKRSGKPFYVIIMDIDYFKKYNDTFGHLAGDELLKKVAEIIVNHVRKDELVIRFGGEEFIVILQDITEEQVKVIWKNISDSIKNETGVTVSGGLSEFRNQSSFKEVIREADDALYQAKESGRNRLEVLSN
ncbi:GGDEF domain-containing protein [Rossellomorea aquimaris]|uniref:GGDEF domain-containing protein n=1 Tax=Rossellomorea aquimaris TaxID=189382 RepID=UPI001CD7D2A2|nr:GGDEF domain-containing protein [Rossellomorea aquimaris]MCA1057590.1 GGDEF domain-containing protein [Rossellomorea aquimaris]